MTRSTTYYQDELTWCVKRATFFPIYVNMFICVAPEVWLILIFGIGYSCIFIIYIFIQFDKKYKQRNHRDLHYTTFLIVLPTVIGINQRFKPIYPPLRLFYGLLLLSSIFYFEISISLVTRFLRIPHRRYQVKTTTEIIANEFHLIGSDDVLEASRLSGKVSNYSFTLFVTL